MADEIFADTWEEREDNHIVVEAEMWCHRLGPLWRQDAVLMIGDVNASLSRGE